LQIGLYLIIALSILLTGYGFGRRVGKSEGYKEGITYAPILLKQNCIESESCPVCGCKIE